MAEQTTQIQEVRESAPVEAFKLGLYGSAQDYITRMQGIDPATGQQILDPETGLPIGPVLPPTQAIAGLTAEQIDAGDLIRTGIGGYEPFLQGALASTQAGQQAITAGALPGIQEALGVQRGSLQTLRDAQSLAAATRAEPFTFRDQALRGLSAAASDITGAQAGVPLQTQAAQQGIAAADVLGQRAAQDAQSRLGLGARQARELAGDVGLGALQTARALGTQLGTATQAGIEQAGQGQQQLLRQAGVSAGTTAGAQSRLAAAARQAEREAGVGQAGILGSRGDVAGIRAGLQGAGATFDPSGIAAFMDPYTQQVVEATRREIMRTGELQKQQADAQAIAAGAFGGSRTGVQRGEIDRAINEQIARQTAGLLSQGFGQALQASQQAFEAGKGRELQAAGLGGQLAQSEAGLAAQAAQMGISTQQLKAQLAQQGAGLGQSQAQLGMQAAQQGTAFNLAAQQEAARNAQALAQQATQAQQLRGSVGLQATGIGQQAAQTGAQLGLSAAEMAQRGAQVGGQLGLQGQQALAQMAGQRANIAQQGGQLGLQFGQLGQADVSQLASLAGQQAQTAQGIGSLAAQGGQLGGRLASMGQIQAGLGQQAQQQRAADAQQLLGFGGMQQQQAQNVLNAQFAAEQAAYAQPLQQLGFLGDLTKALPSSQSSILQSSAPSPGLGQQVAGLAFGAAQLGRAF
jgi:hypothetical protein